VNFNQSLYIEAEITERMGYDIALIPGDGIGREVVPMAVPLLKEVALKHNFHIEWTNYDWGAQRYFDEGRMLPEDGLDGLAAHDAILLGAVGHPDIPDHLTLRGLMLPIRKRFDQGVCKRPTILFDGVESPLRGYEGGEIEFVVFRENTEGEYADIGGREHQGRSNEVAIQSAVYTRSSTETIVRTAFEAADERGGTLTNVTKSNAQAHGMVLWDDIVAEVAQDYPRVEVERLLVDAASMDLIRRPHEFDVIVASNLFGDILTDIGGAISGSIGLAPSANINPTGKYPSMFEPVHGSAPDIAGRSIANPLATVLSGAMLFSHVGEDAAATTVRNLVADQLADGSAPRTPDLGGKNETLDVVADLRERLKIGTLD
jgi:tartrate dehydrogenase/decarboxylase/D-malate dehydrogenase